MYRLVLSVALILFAVAHVESSRLYVDTLSGDDQWDGLCKEWDGGICGPFKTIQSAVNQAAIGDEVVLLDGTYRGPGNRDIDLGGLAITIRSELGDSNSCVIDCEQSGRGFLFQSGEGKNTVISGITVTNGLNSAPGGGAVYCSNLASPHFSNCKFISNGGQPQHGGAVYAESGANPSFWDCQFINNHAPGGEGGALFVESASLRRCFFNGNHVTGISGSSGMAAAIHSSGMLKLSQCTLLSDASGQSVLFLGGANSVIRSSLFVSPFRLIHASGYVTIFGSTLVSNDLLSLQGGSAAIDNSILASLSGSDASISLNAVSQLGISHSLLELGPASISIEPGSVYFPGHNVLSAAPLFFNPDGPDGDRNTLEDNNYRLSSRSLCVNAGDPNYVIDPNDLDDVDLESLPRVLDSAGSGTRRINMGAYEYVEQLDPLSDVNGDARYSFDDADRLMACIRGPEVWLANCVSADLDGDQDADCVDFAVIQTLVPGTVQEITTSVSSMILQPNRTYSFGVYCTGSIPTGPVTIRVSGPSDITFLDSSTVVFDETSRAGQLYFQTGAHVSGGFVEFSATQENGSYEYDDIFIEPIRVRRPTPLPGGWMYKRPGMLLSPQPGQPDLVEDELPTQPMLLTTPIKLIGREFGYGTGWTNRMSAIIGYCGNYLYANQAENGAQIFRSVDDGETWSVWRSGAELGVGSIAELWPSPVDDRFLLRGSGGVLWLVKNTDSNSPIATKVIGDSGLPEWPIWHQKPWPIIPNIWWSSDGQAVFVSTYSLWGRNDDNAGDRIYRSLDAGETFEIFYDHSEDHDDIGFAPGTVTKHYHASVQTEGGLWVHYAGDSVRSHSLYNYTNDPLPSIQNYQRLRIQPYFPAPLRDHWVFWATDDPGQLMAINHDPDSPDHAIPHVLYLGWPRRSAATFSFSCLAHDGHIYAPHQDDAPLSVTSPAIYAKGAFSMVVCQEDAIFENFRPPFSLACSLDTYAGDTDLRRGVVIKDRIHWNQTPEPAPGLNGRMWLDHPVVQSRTVDGVVISGGRKNLIRAGLSDGGDLIARGAAYESQDQNGLRVNPVDHESSPYVFKVAPGEGVDGGDCLKLTVPLGSDNRTAVIHDILPTDASSSKSYTVTFWAKAHREIATSLQYGDYTNREGVAVTIIGGGWRRYTLATSPGADGGLGLVFLMFNGFEDATLWLDRFECYENGAIGMGGLEDTAMPHTAYEYLHEPEGAFTDLFEIAPLFDSHQSWSPPSSFKTYIFREYETASDLVTIGFRRRDLNYPSQKVVLTNEGDECRLVCEVGSFDKSMEGSWIYLAPGTFISEVRKIKTVVSKREVVLEGPLERTGKRTMDLTLALSSWHVDVNRGEATGWLGAAPVNTETSGYKFALKTSASGELSVCVWQGRGWQPVVFEDGNPVIEPFTEGNVTIRAGASGQANVAGHVLHNYGTYPAWLDDQGLSATINAMIP